MSFNTMTDENKEFVIGLYGLKTSLSMLSNEADRLRAAEEREKNLRESVELKQYRKNELQKRYDDVLAKKKMLDAKSALDKAAMIRNIIIGAILFVGSLLSILPFTLIAALSVSLGSVGIALAVFFIGFGIIFAMFIVGLILLKKGIFNSARKLVLNELVSLEKQVAERKAELDSLSAELEKEETAYNEYYTEFKATCRDCAEKSKVIYEATYATYNDILDNRDWGNVDYIIYVYETNRADTLPKALEILGTELRHQDILAAIDHASKEVQRTLTDSIGMLGAQIGAQMEALGNRIEKSNAVTTAVIREAAAAASAQASALRDGVTEQNALLKKSNVNSTFLVNDMHYLTERHKLYGSI